MSGLGEVRELYLALAVAGALLLGLGLLSKRLEHLRLSPPLVALLAGAALGPSYFAYTLALTVLVLGLAEVLHTDGTLAVFVAGRLRARGWRKGASAGGARARRRSTAFSGCRCSC
jgi:NhaP-type Na+/H+ or K+/H+ antiporter